MFYTKGFVHKNEQSLQMSTDKHNDDEPLPSLEMSALVPSAPEVAHVFHMPFTELASSSRLRMHQFRGGSPYWAVDVTDRIGDSVKWTGETPADEVGGGRGGRLEIWGLTGWYLNLFMRALENFR